MTNILIGVGGTGAKIVEAILVMVAAGSGPDKLHVGLVDQDGNNGNLKRTRHFLNLMIEMRDRWSGPQSRNAINWSAENAPALGRTQVLPLFEKPRPNALWMPNQGADSLKGIIGKNLSKEHSDLFDMLFLDNNDEQRLDLDRGYRGRAHVGSAAFVTALTDQNNAFVARMQELMNDASQGPVNIFIVGSAFGGTGAAGFPTLARTLNRMRNDVAMVNGGNVALGGLLMLPYFTFDKPDEEQVSAVSPDELMPKAKMALEYYDNLFDHEQTFDRFYISGWQPFFALGYGKDGGEGQANPALPAEAFAATAALDFFSKGCVPEDRDALASGKVPTMRMSRNDGQLLWRDFPDSEATLDRLGQLLRFAAYWLYLVEPQLRLPDTFWDRNWAYRLADQASIEESEPELHLLRALLGHILTWAATIEHMGRQHGASAGWGEGLWSLSQLLSLQHERTPTEPVALADAFDRSRFMQIFGQMIRFDDSSPVTRAGDAIYADLSGKERQVEAEKKGLHAKIGRVVAATYHSVRVR
jgi:hypothetical protein